MNAEELKAAVVDALATVADQLPEAPPGGRVDPAERLDLRGTNVSDVVGCPAAAALAGEEPFVECAATAGWGAAAVVLDRLVSGHLDPGRGHPPTDPASGFRTALAEVEHLGWPWTWLAGADRAERALTAGEVHRRLSAAARLLSPFPPTGVSHVGRRPSWSFPGRPLRLVGRVDLVLGKRDGRHTLVVVLNGDHGPATLPRLAFEALVESLELRRPPATVLGLLPDAGRRWPVAVDDELLEHGVAVAALLARARLGQRRRDANGLERRPGPRCRECAERASCAEGASWLAGPGRLRAGFLPPGSPVRLNSPRRA